MHEVKDITQINKYIPVQSQQKVDEVEFQPDLNKTLFHPEH